MATEGGGAAAAEEEKEMRVMVAVDQSDGSFYALQWALENLFRKRGAAAAAAALLTVVHVQLPFQHHIIPAGPG